MVHGHELRVRPASTDVWVFQPSASLCVQPWLEQKLGILPGLVFQGNLMKWSLKVYGGELL